MNQDTDTQPLTTPNAPRSAMFIVFLVVFIDLLGFGIVLPLLPRYGSTYLSAYSAELRGIILGLLLSSFSIMQFLFAPVWGRLSDQIGRKPVLLMSLMGSVLFYGLFAYASTVSEEQSTWALMLMFVARVGAGLAGASVSTAAAVIADCTTRESRSKGMALIGAAFGIGFTFGPLIGFAGLEFFSNARWGPGLLASGLSAVALLLAVLLFRETRAANGTFEHRQLFSIQRTLQILKMPVVGIVVFIAFLAIFAFANFEATLTLLTKKLFSLDDRSNFLVFAYIGGVLMLAQGGLYRRFAGKISDARLMLFGLIMMTLGLMGLVAVAYFSFHLQQPDSIQGLRLYFYLSLAVAVTGFAFLNPSTSALVSKNAPRDRQGEVQGVYQSFGALARILGPFIGLTLLEQHPSYAYPYALATLVLLGVMLLSPQVIRHDQPSRGTSEQHPSSANPPSPTSPTE